MTCIELVAKSREVLLPIGGGEVVFVEKDSSEARSGREAKQTLNVCGTASVGSHFHSKPPTIAQEGHIIGGVKGVVVGHNLR